MNTDQETRDALLCHAAVLALGKARAALVLARQSETLFVVSSARDDVMRAERHVRQLSDQLALVTVANEAANEASKECPRTVSPYSDDDIVDFQIGPVL